MVGFFGWSVKREDVFGRKCEDVGLVVGLVYRGFFCREEESCLCRWVVGGFRGWGGRTDGCLRWLKF